LAVAQAVVFLMIAPLAGIQLTWGAAAASIGVMVLVGLMLSALGFLVAWPLDSTQGFHAVMNLFLMPLWLLSGALFPADGAAGWMRWLMTVNPLSYGVAALRHTLYLGQNDVRDVPTFGLSLGITALFTVVMVFLAARAVGRE
jgi:ABC-2 type transport system permease protein